MPADKAVHCLVLTDPCSCMQVREILDAVSGAQQSLPAAPAHERQQQQNGDDVNGRSLRHLLDDSKETLIEAERAFLSRALVLLQAGFTDLIE